LLIEIHPEDERGAELACDLDELGPGRMVPEDIADDEFALRALSDGDDLLGVCDAVRERLLDEHIRARLHRLDGEIGVRVGSVLMETTSSFSSASALSNLSNVFALASFGGSVRSAMRRSHTPTTSNPGMRV
jgi:hypothetical protein